MNVEPKNIIFIDTETTGLGRDARIVQVAWIKSGKLTKRMIAPDGFEIPAEATAKHGITTEKALAVGLPFKDVTLELHAAIMASEMLVCHNTAFDKRMMAQEFSRLGFAFPKIAESCTMLGSTDFCAIPSKDGFKWPSLKELHHKLFDYDFAGAHDAGADISATLQCYFELRRKGVMQ